METYGDAVRDTSTKLGRAAAMLNAERERRANLARDLVASEGVSFEDAITRVWANEYASLRPVAVA